MLSQLVLDIRLRKMLSSESSRFIFLSTHNLAKQVLKKTTSDLFYFSVDCLIFFSFFCYVASLCNYNGITSVCSQRNFNIDFI